MGEAGEPVASRGEGVSAVLGAREDERTFEREYDHHGEGAPRSSVRPRHVGGNLVQPLVEAGVTHLPKCSVARAKVERDASNRAALVGAGRFEAFRRRAKQGAQAFGQRHGRISEGALKALDGLTGMESQGLGDDLRLAAGKKMVDGADRRSAARDELLDAGARKAAFPKQRLGRQNQPFPAPRLARGHRAII